MEHRKRSAAFTIVEVLVSCAILSIILVVLGQMTSHGASILRATSRKTDQFREARAALDSIQLTLSQASLNTYWDYQRASNTSPPTGYLRQSELRYISGTEGDLGLDSVTVSQTTFLGHGVFFQAPLGYVTNATSYGSLHGLLNTCGYYLAFNSDSTLLPGFFSGRIPARNRFRLMEMREPSDKLTLYNDTSGVNASGQLNASTYQGKDWYQTPLGQGATQVLAENIVALVILPQLPAADQKAHSGTNGAAFDATSLAPKYLYDSSSPGQKAQNAYLDSSNQLPPVVQVTLVAIDENSAKLLAAKYGSGVPPLTAGLFTQAANYQADLDQLQATLSGASYTDPTTGNTYSPAVQGLPRMSYRVFTTKFNLLASKWSTPTQ